MNANAREFPTRDILTVTTGRLLTRRLGPDDNGIDGLYKVLEFLCGESPYTHQLGRFADESKRYILDQHPVLDSPEIAVIAVGTLFEMLKTPSGKAEPDRLIEGWLSKYIYPIVGETLSLVPIPRDDHDQIDPAEELEAMSGKKPIVVEVKDKEGW